MKSEDFRPGVGRGAVISPCDLYRYALWRIWQPSLGLVLWIGLNPSTADARRDDPTMRRVIEFTSRWGYGGVLMGNLFAFRDSCPEGMMSARDPVGPLCDEWLLKMAEHASLRVAAWGNHGSHRDRDREVFQLLGFEGLYYLGLTLSGQPKHPAARGDHRIPPDAVPLPMAELNRSIEREVFG